METSKLDGQKLPAIVFLFTINGRSIRHVLRILKTIYSQSHFYYFHVDQVSREKKKLPDKLYFFFIKKEKSFLEARTQKVETKKCSCFWLVAGDDLGRRFTSSNAFKSDAEALRFETKRSMGLAICYKFKWIWFSDQVNNKSLLFRV